MIYQWSYNQTEWKQETRQEFITREFDSRGIESLTKLYTKRAKKALKGLARGEWYTTGATITRAMRKNGEYVYANESEKFWKHSYIVNFSAHVFSPICVNADNTQDAIDYAADMAREWGYLGYFVDYDQCVKDFGENADEWAIAVGGFGLYVNPQELYIKQLD